MDKKAKTILFKTYWSSGGWKSKPETSPEDFEYAKSKGLMFKNESFTVNEIKKALNKLVSEISSEQIVKGFLSSLTNKRLDWRSAIASYFNAILVLNEKREFIPLNDSIYNDSDLNVLNFERIKWAGVRHSDLLYNYIDLKLFIKEQISEPTESDIKIFKNILKTINELPEGEYPSKLRDNLKLVFKGSKNEIHVLMEILGCCEILLPQSHDRPTTGRHDWSFVEFWRGGDKFNSKIVNEYFGNYIE